MRRARRRRPAEQAARPAEPLPGSRSRGAVELTRPTVLTLGEHSCAAGSHRGNGIESNPRPPPATDAATPRRSAEHRHSAIRVRGASVRGSCSSSPHEARTDAEASMTWITTSTSPLRTLPPTGSRRCARTSTSLSTTLVLAARRWLCRPTSEGRSRWLDGQELTGVVGAWRSAPGRGCGRGRGSRTHRLSTGARRGPAVGGVGDEVRRDVARLGFRPVGIVALVAVAEREDEPNRSAWRGWPRPDASSPRSVRAGARPVVDRHTYVDAGRCAPPPTIFSSRCRPTWSCRDRARRSSPGTAGRRIEAIMGEVHGRAPTIALGVGALLAPDGRPATNRPRRRDRAAATPCLRSSARGLQAGEGRLGRHSMTRGERASSNLTT